MHGRLFWSNATVCLAVPGRVVECRDGDAVVDLQGNQLRISLALTPEVRIGDWVLVHAGFAITRLDEEEARETWEYLKQIEDDGGELRFADEPVSRGGDTQGGTP